MEIELFFLSLNFVYFFDLFLVSFVWRLWIKRELNNLQFAIYLNRTKPIDCVVRWMLFYKHTRTPKKKILFFDHIFIMPSSYLFVALSNLPNCMFIQNIPHPKLGLIGLFVIFEYLFNVSFIRYNYYYNIIVGISDRTVYCSILVIYHFRQSSYIWIWNYGTEILKLSVYCLLGSSFSCNKRNT